MSALTPHIALVPDSPSVTLADISPVASAIQKQVTRDFGPIWAINATVDAFEKLEAVPIDYWWIIVCDDLHPGGGGFHLDDHGQPIALVQADPGWELAASHEALEMLADPSGNRTIAGAPPPRVPEPYSHFERVKYLLEVCDPCNAKEFAYEVNGVRVSDFVTPHYFDPPGATGVPCSFRGSVKEPHTVLKGGYVTFHYPVDDHWYQMGIRDGKAAVIDMGKSTGVRSLREFVDRIVRENLKGKHYWTKSPAAIAAAVSVSPLPSPSTARAKVLREYVKGLK